MVFVTNYRCDTTSNILSAFIFLNIFYDKIVQCDYLWNNVVHTFCATKSFVKYCIVSICLSGKLLYDQKRNGIVE